MLMNHLTAKLVDCLTAKLVNLVREGGLIERGGGGYLRVGA